MPLPGVGVDAGHERGPGEVALELEDVLGKRVGGRGVAAERPHRVAVRSRRPAEPEVDAAGVQRLERAELPAITSGEWLGSMMPPEPRRMVVVWAPTWAMSTLVADDAIEAMLWCSAYQTRK